jgi:hypothetical protein
MDNRSIERRDAVAQDMLARTPAGDAVVMILQRAALAPPIRRR